MSSLQILYFFKLKSLRGNPEAPGLPKKLLLVFKKTF
jgi:hypothetical protein